MYDETGVSYGGQICRLTENDPLRYILFRICKKIFTDGAFRHNDVRTNACPTYSQNIPQTSHVNWYMDMYRSSHVMLCYAMLCYVISNHIIYVMSYHTISNRIVSYHIIWYHIISCIISYHVISYIRNTIYTEIEMWFWRNYRHWLHWKLSNWQQYSQRWKCQVTTFRFQWYSGL